MNLDIEIFCDNKKLPCLRFEARLMVRLVHAVSVLHNDCYVVIDSVHSMRAEDRS